MNIITNVDSVALSLQPCTTLKRSIATLINRSKYYDKVWPFFSFGNLDEEGHIVFSNMITLSCNISHSTGFDSINNTIKYQISNTHNLIMLGQIYPSNYYDCSSLEFPILTYTSGYIRAIIVNNKISAYYILPSRK